MGTFAALALVTPIFGFALTPPADLGAVTPTASVQAPVVAQLDASADFDGSAEAGTDGPTADGPGAQDDYVSQVRKRAKIAKVHRTLGIATWAAMTFAVASGTVQYRNLYGGGDLANTPCVQGNAWPRQDGCHGSPTAHLVTGVVTGTLYATTFGLSYAMPDPDDASDGPSQFAKRLRTHKALRWVHLVGMVAQMVLGPIIANSEGLGLDRANDFKTLKALSALHLATGYITWGALGAAGSILMF